MITLFCILLIIAFLVGIVKVFGWLLSAAFHLIPFLLGIFMAIGVIAIAAYLLETVGVVIAIIVIIGLCAGRHHAG
ncbi:MAG: hypothetical protein FRC54_02755 [bacterium LCO1.1]|uniref:Uncharacterized protein n=1 Tax=Candidatus Weimeria bifida TaxID=2599074 RepID=A0A6N7IXE3_9FIRM|nr:hypothetical protein [Candidatus Weimeria bifida]